MSYSRSRHLLPIFASFAAVLVLGCNVEPSSTEQDEARSQIEPSVAMEAEDASSSSPLPPRDSKFALLELPLGVQIEVPKNWRPLDGEISTTIETGGEAAVRLAGFDLPRGQKVNLFRANSNPPTTYASIAINASDSEITPAELLAASAAEIRELSPMMHQMMNQTLSQQDQRIIRWDGVRRQIVDGHPALIINYVRSSPQGPVVVEMTRLFIADKQISLNLAYRQSEAGLWAAIIEYMRASLHVSQS